MKQFKDILVGVDLSRGDQLVCDEFAPPTVEAIERALWLAELNSARLTFFYALDIVAGAQRLIDETSDDDPTLVDKATAILNRLVDRAVAAGIDARAEVHFGHSWMQMIQSVLRDGHDLVVAGTRHLNSLQGILLGSTGVKLLRKCPCPVWITQPHDGQQINSVLVAHCLRPVGDIAMELGCSMAELQRSQLHVLHSLEPHGYQSDASAVTAERHIQSQRTNFELAHEPQIHIVSESPDAAVLRYIQQYGIELIVMGTVARTGIAGFFTGNTAERLLPQISCSVLAVKPPGFVSPVTI